MSLKTLACYVLVIVTICSEKNYGSNAIPFDDSKYLFLGKTSHTVQLADKTDPCNKQQFIEEYVNAKKPLTNVTLKDIRENCTKLINSTSFQCESASFILYYVERTSQYFYYTEIVGLNTANRRDCWGYVLRAQHDHINESQYLNFVFKNDTYTRLYQATPNTILHVDLITFPIGDKADVIIRTPNACQNHVLILLSQRIDAVQPNCSTVLNPDLQERMQWSTKICTLYPKSKALRQKLVVAGISNNCTVSFKQIMTKKTMVIS